MTVLATSALELGVDIERLDVCFIDQIPPSRADLLQRIGRVGRRIERPGLVFLQLSAEPHDRQILDNPCAAFQLDRSKPLPIPIHLDILKLRHVLAAFSEWGYELRRGEVREGDFSYALGHYFGESKSENDLKRLYEEQYGSVVDMEDRAWVHQGFRASASKDKIPLLEGTQEVARIEDIAIFRDAHPEAVYLSHDSSRFRVVDYEGEWTLARWENPNSDTVLGKWLRSITAVRVERVQGRITTRGIWKESFNFYEHKSLQGGDRPQGGRLAFGVWDYSRNWQGYTRVNLDTKEKRKVSLQEVTRRFSQAMERGDRFPFLFPFSYRTLGWQWDFGNISLSRTAPEWLQSMGHLVGSILEHFVADAVESNTKDIGVQVDLVKHRLQILDSTPGGNGLSAALLTEGRVPQLFQNCIHMLSRFKGKNGTEEFGKYILALCHEEPTHSSEEVVLVVRELQRSWAG